jgi:hypothetical protein
MEGYVAEELPNPCERLRIDRRRLLKSSVAITAANLAPILSPSEAASVVSAQTVSTTPEAILNVSAATFRRLQEIQARNLLRKESGLPLLSVAQKFRRTKARQAAQDYANFADRFRRRMQEKVLARIRRETGDNDWKPQGAFQGMAFQNEVSQRLRRVYERVGLETRPSSSSVRISASPR